MKVTSIAQLFEAVQLCIYVLTANDELQKAMNGYGFVPKRVQEGKGLYEYALLMHQTQDEHYNDARRISLQISRERKACLEAFRSHVAIAKTAFRTESYILQELKISRVNNTRWGWLAQAIHFYDKAAGFMERLEQYGANQALFAQNKAAAEALKVLRAQRLRKKGETENSTEIKARSIKALKAWYGEFRKLARIAFQDKPQILESFGMVIPSTPRKRKKTAQAIVEG